MTREVKFRGKRVDNGEWVYGFLLVTQMSGAYIIGTKTKSKPHKIGGEIASVSIGDVVWQYEVDPATVGQYTGLCDKNDKEICEGDIVAFEVWHGGVEHIIAEAEAEKQGKKINWIRPHVVLFNKYGSFCMKPVEFIDDEAWYGYQIPDANKIEIIGNIHDNPDLLAANKPSE